MFRNDCLFFHFSEEYHAKAVRESEDTTSTGYPRTLDGLLEAEGTEFYEQLLYEIYAKFKSIVDIRDRRYHLKKYKQCFIGEDAVRQMVTHGLVASDSQALTLGNIFMEEGLLSHVCEEHAFENNHIFYKFNDNRTFERAFSVLSISNSREEDGDDEDTVFTTGSRLYLENTTSTQEEEEEQEEETEEDTGETEGEGRRGNLRKHLSSESSSSLVHLEPYRHVITALHLCFRIKPLLDIKDRSFRFKTYENVFVGSKFVQVLLDQGLVATLQEALLLSDRLIHQGLLYHVCNEHLMERGELFYRFSDIIADHNSIEDVVDEENLDEDDDEDGAQKEMLKPAFSSPGKAAILTAGFVSLALNPPEESLMDNSFEAHTFYMKLTKDDVYFFVNERSAVYAFKQPITLSSSLIRFEALRRGFIFGEEGKFYAFRFGTKNQFLQAFQAFEYVIREQLKLLPKAKKKRGTSLRTAEGDEKKLHN